MKKFLFAVLLAFPALVMAQAPTMNVGLSWGAPTQYTDGSPLNPATDLQGYTVLCGTSSQPTGNYPLVLQVPPTQTSVSREQLVEEFTLQFDTVYYCALRTTATNGKMSARSEEVSFQLVDERTPAAPTLSVE